MYRSALLFAVIVCVVGCATKKKHVPLHVYGDPVQQLMETDLAFAQESANAGAAQAFSHYTDAASIRVTASGPLVQGSEQFRQAAQQMPAGSVLVWAPREARVALSGDLGWTWGEYEFRPAPGTGEVTRGRYLTVWHRSGDGSWRISADIGTEAGGP